MFLAQANVAMFRWPLDDPRMAEFTQQIDSVNTIASQSDGYVWRWDGSYAPVDAGTPWDEPLLFFNMSVWRDLDCLHRFVRCPQHLALMRDREKWLLPVHGSSSAMWWIHDTTLPCVEDAIGAISLQSPPLPGVNPTGSLQSFQQPFVESLERSLWQTVVQRDGAGLGRVFSDDYVEITLHGQRIAKDRIVQESPESDEIRNYRMEDTRMMSLGIGAILLSYHAWIDGTFNGEPILPKDRWATSTWRSQGGMWQCCFFQQSPYSAEGNR